MKILAIESSAKAASVALCHEHVLIAQYFQNSGLTHSRTLLKMLEDMLSNLDLSVKDLDLVAVASGPGSFTGIRIGVSAAIGLAWGAELPVCGVSTLEAMAHQIEQENCLICPVMDARRGQVYTGLFEYINGTLVRINPDCALSVAELSEAAFTSRKPYLLLGDGTQLCADAFTKHSGIHYTVAPPLLRAQTAWGVACASLKALKLSPNDLKPNYLRVSQAEREQQAKSR